MEAFEAWLRARGADTRSLSFDNCFESLGLEAEGEMGVFAGRRIPILGRVQRLAVQGLTLGFAGKEHLIAEFPLDIALTPATALNDENEAVADIFERALAFGSIDAREAVILYLLLQERRGGRSKWAPYINVLPGHPRSCSLLEREDLDLVRGTNLHRAISALQSDLPRSFSLRILPIARALLSADGLAGGEVTLDEYKRHYSTFWSRTLALPVALSSGSDENGEREWIQMDSLVPGLDLINHSFAERNARWQVRVAKGRGQVVEVLATRPLGAGDQVYIQYGDRSNEQLMFQYGFAEEDNPNDSVMIHLTRLEGRLFDASNAREAAAWREKMDRVRALGLPTRAFLPSVETGKTAVLPGDFMATLRVLVGEEEGDQERSFAALTLMMKILQESIYVMESEEEGTGTMEGDESLLAEDERAQGAKLTKEERGGIIYRCAQKRIARAHLRACQEELDHYL